MGYEMNYDCGCSYYWEGEEVDHNQELCEEHGKIWDEFHNEYEDEE